MTISYPLKTISGKQSNDKFKTKLNKLYDLITNRIDDTQHIPKISSITHDAIDTIDNFYNNYKISTDANLKLVIQDLDGNRVDLNILDNLFSITSINSNVYTLKHLITFYNYLIDCNDIDLTKDLKNNTTNIKIIKGSHLYVIDVLKHYYFLVILYCFLLVLQNTTTDLNHDNKFYKSLNTLTTIYMSNVQNNIPTDLIVNYDTITDKISKSSGAYLENQKLSKITQKYTKNNKNNLDYMYNIIIVIIILTIVALLLSIYFRNNVPYMVIGLISVIILNIIFLTAVNVPYVEKFSSDPNICNYDDMEIIQDGNPKYLADNLYKQLCKLACGLHFRYIDEYVESLYYGVKKLQNEKHKYEKLKSESKRYLLLNKEYINNDTLTFYQRKEYANLFIRLTTLFIVILILLNIFGDEAIVKIFGFVFFCLIFMVYLYNIKVVSRTNTNKRYWNHRYQY